MSDEKLLRYILIGLSAGIILVVIFWTVFFATQTGRTADENNTIRYIGFMVYDPVYVAYELGFFEEHGVKVEIIDLMTAGPTALQAISGGNAEAGLSFTGAIINARAQGLPVIGVSDIQSSFQHAPLAEFFVRADSGIYGIRDLRGRIIAINLVHASFHHKWLMALESYGIHEDEVYWTVLPFDQQELALMHGRVDAIGVLQPHTVRPRSNPDFKRIMTAYDVFGERQFTLHVFNSAWADNNPALVEGFVAAIADAVDWIEANQEAAREIIARHTGVDIRYIENYYFQPHARVNIDDAGFWLDYMFNRGDITADWLTVEDFATNRFNRRMGN